MASRSNFGKTVDRGMLRGGGQSFIAAKLSSTATTFNNGKHPWEECVLVVKSSIATKYRRREPGKDGKILVTQEAAEKGFFC